MRLTLALFTVAALFCVANECHDFFHKFLQIHVGLSLQTDMFLKRSIQVRVNHSKNVSPQRRGFDPGWKKCQWDSLLYEYFGFPFTLSVSYNQHSTFIHSFIHVNGATQFRQLTVSLNDTLQ
jgi:hypothetical protein